MLDEITKTIKAQLYERAASPLIATFVISWSLWNYRLLFVLISSDLTLYQKFNYIDVVLYPSFSTVLLGSFTYPFLTSLFMIYLYPFPARIVFEHTRKQQQHLKTIQQKIEDETPLTQVEARAIRREAIRATDDFQKEISRQAEEIARLKLIIADQERDVAANKNIVSEQAVRVAQKAKNESSTSVQKAVTVTEDMLSILNKMSELDENKITSSDLKAKIDRDNLSIDHDIDQLVIGEYLAEKELVGGKRLLSMTKKGRSKLVENIEKRKGELKGS